MTLGQDLRYAFRQLRCNPGFAFTAILTLALGIGATTAVFSVVEQMLLTQFEMVSPSFPDVFGVRPIAGALFHGDHTMHQALVSEASANVELGGVTAAVGKLISMESVAYQVVGVMSHGFDFPRKARRAASIEPMQALRSE